MKELFKTLINWIKSPDDTPWELSFQEKTVITGQLFLLDLLIALVFTGLAYFIHFYVVKLESTLLDWDLTTLIVAMVIIAPLVEEFIFRFPLKFRRNYLARFIDQFVGYKLAHNWHWLFKYFVYFLIALFGFLHITNYENDETIFYLLSPLIIGSQLIGGLILSFTRIKLGFVWAVFQHGVFNGIVFSAGLLFHNQPIVTVSNDDLTLEIRELIYIKKDEVQYNSQSDNDLLYTINAQNISLFQLVDSLQNVGTMPYDNRWISVEMNSQEGILKEELLKVLKKEITFDELMASPNE